MSLSFRKGGIALAIVAMSVAVPAGWAQQRYFIPTIEVGAEYDTNRELRSDSDLEEKSTSYKATLEARMGQQSPRTTTELRPRMVLQEYPDRDGVDPLEAMLALSHEYRGQKGSFDLQAQYKRQDTINAELGDAGFDDDDDPTTPPVVDDVDSGITFGGVTRDTISASPSFNYQFSEVMGFAGTAQYQSVRYDDDEDSTRRRVGFDAPYAELNLTRKLAPRTVLSVGPFFANYKADNDSLETDTYGLRIGLDHQWTERSSVTVALRGERDESTFASAPGFKDTSDNWGLEILGARSNRVGSIRYAIGRFLQPSTLGSRRQSDQIRVQYDRPLSDKLTFKGSVRFSQDEAVSGLSSRDRDRVHTELSLTRLFTRTWYISGGYRFVWQDVAQTTDDVDGDSTSASNNLVFLTVGFKGRDPRRGGR